MKLVIEIPDEMYLNAKTDTLCGADILVSAIKNGKPLPKGHGRLIDADAYIGKHEECGWLDDITVDEFNTITPTIIEADEEGAENDNL